MATRAGLSFENDLYRDSGGVPSAVVNPFGYQNAASASGADALGTDTSDIAMMGGLGVQLARQNRFTAPQMTEPSLAYNRATNQLYVQGVTFDADDAQSIVESERLLGGRPTGLPTEGNWEPLSPQAYGQLVQGVKNPSMGTLAARNFGRGVDSLQMLAGRGLQLMGAEETGGRIVEQQAEDLRKTTPYERQFTDIGSAPERGVIDWFVANLAQQGPNILESVAVGLAGAAAGTAAAGPGLGTAAGALAGLVGKKAFKDKVVAAATKYRQGTAGLDDIATLKNASAITGAVAANYASNYAMGAADIYGEMREQGALPADFDARMVALAGAVPYAGLELLGEYVTASRLLGGSGRAALPAGATMRARGGELLKRFGIGATAGGLAEGTTELGQEGLVMGLSGQDLTSPEAVSRFVNSFAAGAAIGGPISGIGNLRSTKEQVNLLSAPSGPRLPQGQRGTQGELFPARPGEMAGPAFSPLPEQPAGAPVSQPGQLSLFADVPEMATQMPLFPGEPGEMAGPAFSPLPEQPAAPAMPQAGQMALFQPPPSATPERIAQMRESRTMPAGPGMQGQLPLVGGAVAPGYVPPAAPEVEATTQLPMSDPRQGALQFAGEAPTGPANPQMANQLQAVQGRLARQQTFDQAEAQQAAQIQQQLEALAQSSSNARDLFLAGQEAQNLLLQPLPVSPQIEGRRAGPSQPAQGAQLPLFTRRQAPVPPKAGQLRRGGRMQITTEAPAGGPAAPTQLSLFTQEGEPSVASLKSAGKKTKLPPAKPTVQPKATPGARGLRKGAKVAEVTVTPPAVTPQGEPNAVQVESPTAVPVQPGAEGGKGVGEKVRGPKKPARKSEAKPEAKKPLKKAEEAPPSPKPEAAQPAAETPSAATEAPADVAVPLELVRADGTKVKIADARKYLEKLDRDIERYDQLLVCLTRLK